MILINSVKTLFRSRLVREQRAGVAIIMLLGFLVLAVPIASGSTQIAGQLARNSNVYNDRLDRAYCLDAGIEHALHRIIYEAGYADSLTDTDPSNTYTVTLCNGEDVQITVACVVCQSGGSDYTFGDLDYIVPAGHQIEFKVTTHLDSDDDMWLAYDTDEYPAWLDLPSPDDGDVKYRFHNNPSPPTADTNSQHPLSMDEVVPTGSTLYNYDMDRDSLEGLLIQKDDEKCDQTDPVKYQDWLSPTLASSFHIEGDVTFTIWVGMKDFDLDKNGSMWFCLRDYDGSSYTTIADNNVQWNQSTWTGEWYGVGSPVFDIEAVSNGETNHVRVESDGGSWSIVSWHIE